MYGQAEATTRISCFCTSDYPEKTASVGKPLRGGCVEIKNNAAIGTDEPIEGEIVYRGNNVCMGYALARKDLKNGDDWNGELGTGDIGFVDEDGFLFITGRKKRIVKLYGHSVSLDDIEKQLNTSSSARFSCIADGEKVVVFHERLEIEGLQASLAKLFKLQPKDFQFIKIDATPRTDNGKVNYHSLEQMVHSSD
jgi:acyl-CoA synthetase (AMP-forming)/AMP-acid ligase II